MNILKNLIKTIRVTITGCVASIPGVMIAIGVYYSGGNVLGAVISVIIGIGTAGWLIANAVKTTTPWYIVMPVGIATYTYVILSLSGQQGAIKSTPTFYLGDHELRVATGLALICLGLFIWRCAVEYRIAEDRRKGLY